MAVLYLQYRIKKSTNPLKQKRHGTWNTEIQESSNENSDEG